MTKPTVSKHWRKPVGRQRSGLNHIRTTPPCYNNRTLGNRLYAQRKGPNVVCMLYYCNTVGWAWWDWGLIRWLTILLQCFDTVGWVTWPVKISSPNDLYCVEWDVKPYSTQPNVTNPICLTCKNCSHKCAADCEHCVTQSSTELFW